MKVILKNVIARITLDQQRRLERIDAEDFSLVAKKVAEELAKTGITATDEYLERGIYALKQYYAVALLDPANAHAVTLAIDPFWHAHILFTAEYRRFCDEVIGEYMDHVPLDKDDTNKVANVRQLYGYTLEIMPKLFSDLDPVFWPTHFSDNELICMHKGNQDIYPEVQADRIFEPNPAGAAWAYV